MTIMPTSGLKTIFARATRALLFLMMALWMAAPHGAWADSDDDESGSRSRLVIWTAQWEDASLYARGTAPASTTVTIENTVSGEVLGSIRSSSRGYWRFSGALSMVPCSITAKAGDSSATRDVANAPSNCDEGQPPAPMLTSLTITGPTSVIENSSAQYTGTASYSDGTTQDVTAGAAWSDNSGAVSVSGGQLSAGPVSSDQTVVITAAFGGLSASYTVTIQNLAATLSGLTISGPASVDESTSAQYTGTANFSDGTTQNVTAGASWSDNSGAVSVSGGQLIAGPVSADETVIISASYTFAGVSVTAVKNVMIIDQSGSTPPDISKSINSTSQNRATLPTSLVSEQPLVNLNGFKVFGVNDLGMHCGDLDHRVASILPPFNVLHALAVRQGTGSSRPAILTPSECEVVYSASANPLDPALQNPPGETVYKTNFWDLNPVQTGNSLGFDAYDPFYPPDILGLFPLDPGMGLPVPDLALLYPLSGAGQLAADQQEMPGFAAPFADNSPQVIKRFDTDLPFFVDFPFGYRLTEMNWFAADGIPMTPFDDSGRKNSFPLVRVQSRTINTGLTGSSGDVLSSVDVVLPVSAEADCFRCHGSSQDGGGAKAACIPGIDAQCTEEGSPRSGTAFPVAVAADDTADVPFKVKREWAADNNIIRLHDAKHNTNLQANTPVACQTCHYTPALDLAHLGPIGPDDPNANGKEQKIHQSNSRVMHSFHAQFTDLFADDMPSPSDSRRRDPSTGELVVNAFVKDKLNQSCYQCHPGRETQCLRGTMFSAGLICQDCHGGMEQVGDDFSRDFSASSPFPAGADLTKRVPWASVPACQSCHTGDARNNLGQTDSNVIRAADGIRLLQAYRTNDTANATPIVATNKRFAENDANGNRVLYRYSKGHSGLACEVCHGSTHAEWPVQPESGNFIANDNLAAIQLQGHTGKIIECATCHTESLPSSLDGPHGLHPVGATRFANGGHENLAERSRDACRACHGNNGQGTVLSKAAVARSLSAEGRRVNLAKGQMVSCNLCHGNPL